mgnify:CR=1 FL=1
MAKIPKNLPQNGPGTWAVNIDVFDQKRSVHQNIKPQPSSIKAKGDDKITDGERFITNMAVNQFNRGVREAKNIKPFRKLNIRKSS